MGNAENAGSKPAFLPFCMFPRSTLLKTSFNFGLQSANALNLDQSKILSFGKELNLFSPFSSEKL